jgi:hypothetical protein
MKTMSLDVAQHQVETIISLSRDIKQQGLFRQTMKTLLLDVACRRATTIGVFLIVVVRHQATGFSLSVSTDPM